MIFNQEVAAFDAPEVIFSIGVHMGGPTLIAHGTDAQKQRWLRPLLRGEEIWCQLFSEPDAGSDLASLRTTAIRDGDDFVRQRPEGVVVGRPLRRLGHAAGPHRSRACRGTRASAGSRSTCATPGITVRPLKQMNGGAHFNEVFFEDVRVPIDNVVGAVNDGWTVAATTLLNERLMAGDLLGQDDMVGALIELARTSGANTSPLVRHDLARIVEATQTLRYHQLPAPHRDFPHRLSRSRGRRRQDGDRPAVRRGQRPRAADPRAGRRG